MPKPIRSVLVANRGEIAVRIIAACQELGQRTIAVYSDADTSALHVRLADEAHRLGPAPAHESYLSADAILRVAALCDADAIHPGYGFLSENADFAERCEQAGIIFIGPPASAIRLLGSKTAAKHAVEQRGVPTVPGYAGPGQDARTLQREAARIGYPIMLKAAAGGGGKGMRMVHAPAELEEALAAAQREALAAFGDASVFLEKLLVAPRHVEFQILADQYGHTIHLGERECSIQRRHQKIIEESPCIALPSTLREEMGHAAVRAAEAAGYVNAGTCEFLLDRDGQYYFLEMNTRLQVEHPVTEFVTGLDLVRHQLAIAAGEPLALSQEQIVSRGHAIEARLYAEDPAQNYLPSIGQVLLFDPPHAPGVRVDAGISTGDEVSMYYDPMLAKLIVSAENRPAAIERLRWALDHLSVLGVTTNASLLRAIAAEPDFAIGATSTAYLDTHDFAAQLHPERQAPPIVAAAAALWESIASQPRTTTPSGPYNPWRGGAQAALSGERSFRYADATGAHAVTSLQRSTGEYVVQVDGVPLAHEVGATIRARALPSGGVTLAIGPRRELVYVARRGHELLLSWRGQTYTLATPQPPDVDAAARGGEALAGAARLIAPMAGTIIKVLAREGERVNAHQTLVVLGAMKMEHAISAPHAGTVKRLRHVAGDVVTGGTVLVEMDDGAQS